MRGKRVCYMHGGSSTGPTSAEGLERCREAATKHGYYTPAVQAERQQVRQSLRRSRAVVVILSGKQPSDVEIEALTPVERAVLGLE